MTELENACRSSQWLSPVAVLQFQACAFVESTHLRMTGELSLLLVSFGLVAIRAKYDQLKQLEFVTRLPDRLFLFFCIVRAKTRKYDVKECLC